MSERPRAPKRREEPSPWSKVARDPRRLVGAAAGAAAVVAILVVGIVAARDTGPATAPPAANVSGGAVSLEGTDPVTGERVSLASFKGKPVVINIWASWCPGCIAEARDLRTFAEQHPEAQVIGIDYQDSKAGAKEFYDRFGWRHPSIFDPDGAIAARLGLQGLPTTIFLDSQHRLVTRIVGETNLAGFNGGLREAKNA